MGKVVIGWEIRGFNPKIGTNIVDTVEATVIIKVKSRKGRFIMDTTMSNVYLKILAEELVPATGCTEPIALAYAAAIVKDTLGENPERMVIEVSGNIIKNVKALWCQIREAPRESRPPLPWESLQGKGRKNYRLFPVWIPLFTGKYGRT